MKAGRDGLPRVGADGKSTSQPNKYKSRKKKGGRYGKQLQLSPAAVCLGRGSAREVAAENGGEGLITRPGNRRRRINQRITAPLGLLTLCPFVRLNHARTRTSWSPLWQRRHGDPRRGEVCGEAWRSDAAGWLLVYLTGPQLS